MSDLTGKTGHGGNIWAASHKYQMPAEEFLDFSANINPLGPSPMAIKAIQDNLGLIKHYPEPNAESCRRALSNYLGITENQLILGNGGSELIYLLGRLLYKSRILLLAPCFSEYGEGIAAPLFHHVYLNSEEQFRLPMEEITQEITEGDLIFIGNPNNPTGNLFPYNQLLEIVHIAEYKKIYSSN